MKQLRTIFTVLILLAGIALGVMFALQNKQAVPLDMLVVTFPPRSLALWILAAFALGGLAGLLISWIYLLRARAALGSSRRQLARTRAELEQLRGANVQARSTELTVGE
jgi:putative membrane protein